MQANEYRRHLNFHSDPYIEICSALSWVPEDCREDAASAMALNPQRLLAYRGKPRRAQAGIFTMPPAAAQ